MIEAMKQALEALDAYSWEQVDSARAALRQAIEQAEKQEPVLWKWKDSEMVTPFDKTNVEGWTPLYTTPQPQREWVGLTPDEVFGIADQHPVEGFDPDIMAYTRAIEAKLKDKNNVS